MGDLDNSKPVFRVDGEVSGALRNDVQWLSVEEDTQGMKRLHACFVAQSGSELSEDQPLTYLDGDVVDFGKALAVSLGSGSSARTVFEGKISGIEAELVENQPAQIALHAEDGLMALRMTRRSKTYRDATDEDIARQVAEANGLEFSGGATGPTYELVQQWNQSDLAFLRSRARFVQAEIWLRGRTLHFAQRPNRSAPEIPPVAFGNQILEVNVRADLAHQRSEVEISGYDAQRREGVSASATEQALQAEITGGRTGPATLQRSLGDGYASYRVRDVALNREEAEAWAKAEALRRGRRFVTASGVLDGIPDVQVGCRLDLRRVGRPFTGCDYYVTRVCHTWHPTQGHRTAFEAERAVISEAG